MSAIYDRLLKGDDSVPRGFSAAKDLWDRFHSVHQKDNAKALCDAIGLRKRLSSTPLNLP